MKRFALVLLTVAFAMTLANTALADDWRRIELRGTISAIGDGGITLIVQGRDRQKREVRIAVTDRTRITRNGRRATLRDLRLRDEAFVRAVTKRDRRGRKVVAYEIHARGDGR